MKYQALFSYKNKTKYFRKLYATILQGTLRDYIPNKRPYSSR